MKNQTTNSEKILPDEEIIELYWQRNEKAISATDTKYGKYLFTIAYNIIKNRQDCEECLDDTYLGVWNSIPPTRPTVFQIFISKMMRNAAINRFREKTARKRVPSELISSYEELSDCIRSELTPEIMGEMIDIARILNEFLYSLSEDDAFIFVCRYYYSDSIEKIAGMMQLSKQNVYRDLTRMRSALRECFDKEGIQI